jgi:hypothetical protein
MVSEGGQRGGLGREKDPTAEVRHLSEHRRLGSHLAVGITGDKSVGAQVDPFLGGKPPIGLGPGHVVESFRLVNPHDMPDQSVDVVERPGPPGESRYHRRDGSGVMAGAIQSESRRGVGRAGSVPGSPRASGNSARVSQESSSKVMSSTMATRLLIGR